MVESPEAAALHSAEHKSLRDGSAAPGRRPGVGKIPLKIFRRFVGACGPGLLCGIIWRDWLRLLLQNRCRIAPEALPRALAVSFVSIGNSAIAAYERLVHPLRDEPAAAPLFILGHWRSGTTHLQNLIACDPRFVTPTLFQVLFPQTFLSTERLARALLAPLIPETRPFDNVQMAINTPNEDEYALCTMTLCSPFLSTLFPRRDGFYDRYLTFEGVDEREIREWQAALSLFVRKIGHRTTGIPLLKSPRHTCRIRRIMEVFPDARFVHIHRDPRIVFQSTQRMFLASHRRHRFQRRECATLDERIIRQYREMYAQFFLQRPLIPEGHFAETSFSKLESDPVTELRRIYEELSLPAFAVAEDTVRSYLRSLGEYQKNAYPALPPDVEERLRTEWRSFFDAWGY
jgi:omega-hydroxy-beta-dihydromenaquinone-9 sulfotransferase